MIESELQPTESGAAVAAGNAEPEKHVVLALENVSKRFCRDLKRSLFYGVKDIASELIGRAQPADRLRESEFWATRDINFELRSGDAMGIVGINGCGKTTLMRIIAGLIKPTTGRVIVRGRLAPLLALGAGFNPVLTGRENIIANMSVLGLTYEEIMDRFDSVVEFSEIGYAIDAPVQTYSSGMVARLGFACAINTQPDILLLDEVLAVGDMNFRRKCLERLFEMRSTGMSLIMVHHSPGILLSIAETALYLQRGRVEDYGPIAPIIQRYQRDLAASQPGAKSAGGVDGESEEEILGSDEVDLQEVTVEAADGGTIKSGEDATVIARIHVKKPLEQLNFTLMLYRLPSLEALPGEKRALVQKMISRRDGGSLSKLEVGDYEVRVDLPSLGLVAGDYQIEFRLSRPVRVTLAMRSTAPFSVTSQDPISGGSYFQRREWSVTSSAGFRMSTQKFLASAETADDLMDLEDINAGAKS
jgi:lipopolysaccharide transport system ATP-binding protein